MEQEQPLQQASRNDLSGTAEALRKVRELGVMVEDVYALLASTQPPEAASRLPPDRHALGGPATDMNDRHSEQGDRSDGRAGLAGGAVALTELADALLTAAAGAAAASIERGNEIDAMLAKIREVRAATLAV